MDDKNQIAFTVLTDSLGRIESLLSQILEQVQEISAVLNNSVSEPENLGPPCRMAPVAQTTEPEKEYTFEQVRTVFTEQTSHGLKAEMKAILAAHGLQKISDAQNNQRLLNQIGAEAEAVSNA